MNAVYISPPSCFILHYLIHSCIPQVFTGPLPYPRQCSRHREYNKSPTYVCVLLAQSCLTLWSYELRPIRLLCPWNSPGKSTGVGCHFLLQGIFPTQGSNPDLPHCRQILYCLRHFCFLVCHRWTKSTDFPFHKTRKSVHVYVPLLSSSTFLSAILSLLYWACL